MIQTDSDGNCRIGMRQRPFPLALSLESWEREKKGDRTKYATMHGETKEIREEEKGQTKIGFQINFVSFFSVFFLAASWHGNIFSVFLESQGHIGNFDNI